MASVFVKYDFYAFFFIQQKKAPSPGLNPKNGTL